MLDLGKYRFIKYIILDDRKLPTTSGTDIQIGYKPTKETLSEVGRLLPQCKILGFRPYYHTVWCLEVTDPSFVDLDIISMNRLKHKQANNFMRLLP